MTFSVNAKGSKPNTASISRAAGPSARFSLENGGFSMEMRLSEQRRLARIAGERLFGGLQYRGIPVLGGITGVTWYNVPVTDPLHIGDFLKQPQAVSAAEARHAHSHQTPPAQRPRAAPQTTSFGTSQTSREPHGQMGRAIGERHLPMVL